MSFRHNRELLVGVTSGIRAVMVDRLAVMECAKGIAVGRREDRLDAFVQRHGSRKG